MNAQFKKGLLEMCILYIISNQKLYGYEILKTMQELFPSTTESTFYAILRRLNSEEYTIQYTGEKSKGPTRKYYEITMKGNIYLQDMLKDLEDIQKITKKLGIQQGQGGFHEKTK